MKKIIGLLICMMLGLSVVGCSETSEQPEIEDTQIKVEEQVEKEDTYVEEETEEKEEPKEEVEETPEVITIENDEEFKRMITTSLNDDEYNKYFGNHEIFNYEQKIEINGTVIGMNLRDGYDTRFELVLVCGDTEDSTVGPYVKIKDIVGLKLGGINVGTNVKVIGHNVKYNTDNGWLEIGSVDEITTR